MRKILATVKQRKRIAFIFGLFMFFVLYLIFVLIYRQLIKGEEYLKGAREQQTSDSIVNANRGLIYDRNYKVLARNITVETISITPELVRNNDAAYNDEKAENSTEKGETRQTVEEIAEKLGEILEIDSESILNKIKKTNSGFEYIKKKVDKEVADKVREYIEKYSLTGINFTSDTKRFYPYSNFASHVIGFVGGDNQGLEGIELVYDDELSGTPGRIVSGRHPIGLELPEDYESYIEPTDGLSVVLTIDETIQHFVEKHLENARINNRLEEGAASIVMDVKTGEILAMATKPDYDLNAPFEITEAVEERYPNIKEELESLDGADYNARLTEVVQPFRKNKAVVDSYEPGSTFKIAVASMALEEKAVKLTDRFYCRGSIKVADRTIGCANRNGHGAESFVEGVQNSCNPVFIEVGARVGRSKFLSYLKGFGFLDKTGIELPGEVEGIFHNPDDFKEIDLATASFGQGFNVTPLQIITAASAVANGGVLTKPHLVKQLVDSEKRIINTTETEFVRQAISKETADTMCEILETVVSEGGGKNAYLAGYRIAGKTGTSEKQPRGNGKYIASFIGFAPADDPQVACLVILDQPPQGATYYGGIIAAPVVKSILEETLQYIGVEPKYTQEEKAYIDITVPNVTGMTKEEAKTALSDIGLNCETVGDGDIIVDQIPKVSSKLSNGSKVVVYTEGSTAEKTVTIPNLKGCTASQANKLLTDAGLNIRIKGLSANGGAANCISQTPSAGTSVERGTVVTLEFAYSEVRD